MKGLIINSSISICLLLLTSSVFAKEMSQKHLWVCETNASATSSTSTSDVKANDMMKKGKSARSAFDFALNHCKDCTTITCTLQTQSTGTGTMGQTGTTTDTTNQTPTGGQTSGTSY